MLDAALEYASLGYAVFPLIPGGKAPLTSHGLLDATTDAEVIEAWWHDTPDANIGLVTAGLFVLDIDGEHNRYLANETEKQLSLAVAPLSLTAGGGKHYVFKQPAGRQWRNTASKVAPYVDTRADGGYIVVPPSKLGDGRSWRWSPGNELECEPSSLPEPPAWLTLAIDNLTGNHTRPAERLPVTFVGDAIPDGQRNQTLTSIAGSMRRAGRSRNAIAAAIWQENLERCRPPLPREEIERIAESVERYAPDQIATLAAELHGANDEPEAVESGPADPGSFPESLLAVPGFIGELMEYNLAGAIKPQPELALAAGLSVLATLTGRKVQDSYGTRTNLYCLGVVRSGFGKERARQVNKELLYVAGLDRLIGPEDIASHAGLVSAVEKQPALLLQLDEIGRLLKTLGDGVRSPHLYGIVTVLLKLFTSSNSVFKGAAYADSEKNKTVHQPHCCLYGTTVPQSLYEGLTAESVTDGFLSRLLIFEGRDIPRQSPKIVSPPAKLIDTVRWWGDFKPGGNLSSEIPQPIIVPYDDNATVAMTAFEMWADEQLNADDALATLWTRAAEKARKLALLFACSDQHDKPQVSLIAVQWAIALSRYLTERMMYLAGRWVSRSPYDAKRKALLRDIESAGKEGLTRTGLVQKLKHLPRKERDELLDDLVASGEVVMQTRQGRTKWTQAYVARGCCT